MERAQDENKLSLINMARSDKYQILKVKKPEHLQKAWKGPASDDEQQEAETAAPAQKWVCKTLN